jgi:hypothetical protein
MASLLPQLAIIAGMFAFRGLTWLYWREYIQPSFDQNGADPKEYAKRKNSGLFFQIGVMVILLLLTSLTPLTPGQQKTSALEFNAVAFFLIMASFCFSLLGVGSSLRYLKEKNVEVTPFGKVVLVFEDATYALGMVAFYYLGFRDSAALMA